MAEKKSRINTDELFNGLIGKEKEAQKDVTAKTAKYTTEPNTITTPARSPKAGINVGLARKQVSIYLSPDMDRELSVQGAMKEKGTDKSAIARIGIEIVLALSTRTYLEVKRKAESDGKSIGDVVQEVLANSF